MLEQAVCKYLVETITRVEDEAEATGLGRLISFCILINWNVWPAVEIESWRGRHDCPNSQSGPAQVGTDKMFMEFPFIVNCCT